jgi:hypothetical protein
LPFVNTVSEQRLDFSRMFTHGGRPSIGPTFLAGLGNPGLHAIAQNIAFELSFMRFSA